MKRNMSKRLLLVSLILFLVVNTRISGQDQSPAVNDVFVSEIETDGKEDNLTTNIWPIISMYDFNLSIETSNTTDKIEMIVSDEYGDKVFADYFMPGQIKDTIYKFGGNLDSGQYFVKVVQKDKVYYQSLVRR